VGFRPPKCFDFAQHERKGEREHPSPVPFGHGSGRPREYPSPLPTGCPPPLPFALSEVEGHVPAGGSPHRADPPNPHARALPSCAATSPSLGTRLRAPPVGSRNPGTTRASRAVASACIPKSRHGYAGRSCAPGYRCVRCNNCRRRNAPHRPRMSWVGLTRGRGVGTSPSTPLRTNGAGRWTHYRARPSRSSSPPPFALSEVEGYLT
jgi:hypothetical protein